MKIFLTGSEGFIGKELVSQCKKQEIEVVGVDFKKNPHSNSLEADIRSKNIAELIPEGVDAICHLAALSSDVDCKNKGYDCFDINVRGTLNLIEAAKLKRAKQFIFASSEWVYDNCSGENIKDEDSLINIANHKSEYALSKIVSEANLRQAYRYDFCPTTILRFGIVYGVRPDGPSAVESIFKLMRDSNEISIGSLHTGRCFIHVSDLISGIIKSIGLDGFNTINLSGDKLITLGDIIEVSGKILNKNPKINETSPDNISVRNISNEKAKKLLNWKSEVDLMTGLNKLNNFFK